MFITFSGLDGAGKSTLIARLRVAIESRGERVRVLTMYDDIGVYAWARKLRGRSAARRASVAVHTRDTRERAPRWLTAARSARVKRLAYLFDLITFVGYRIWFEGVRGEVLILDRYFYDSLADVADGRRWRYVRAFLAIAPTPTVPVLVDTTPEESYRRKGEYSVEHLTRRRELYHEIFRSVRRPFIVLNDRLEETARAIIDEVSARTGARA